MKARGPVFGQYVDRNSAVHGLDPRTKLLGLTALMLSLMGLPAAGYAAATVMLWAFVRLSRIPLLVYVRALKPVWILLAVSWLYNSLFGQGQTVLVSWSWVTVTAEGMMSGTLTVWRIALMVLLATMLTLTTKPLVLSLGLQRLLAPLSRIHVPVEQVALMIVIAIRFIPVIIEELDRVMLAQKARGFDIAAFRKHERLFAYLPVILPLILTILQRAERLSLAIDARGYGGGQGRSTYRQLKWTRRDLAAGAGIACCVLILLVIRLLPSPF